MKKRYIFFLLLIYFLTPKYTLAEDYSDVSDYKDVYNVLVENDVPFNVCIWHAEGDNAVPGATEIALFFNRDTGIYVHMKDGDKSGENQFLYDKKADETEHMTWGVTGNSIRWDMLLSTNDFINFWITTKSCPETIQVVDWGGKGEYRVVATESLTGGDYAYTYSRNLITGGGNNGGSGNTDGNGCHANGADSCSNVCYKKTKNYQKEIWFEIGYISGLKYLVLSMNSEFTNRTMAYADDNNQILLDINKESYQIGPDAIDKLFKGDGTFLDCEEIAIGETKNGPGTVFWIGTDDTILGDDRDHAEDPPEEDPNDNDDGDGKKYDELSCKGLWGDPDNPNEPAYWVQWALDLIKYLAIIALLVFSTIDFVKAFVSQDREAINHALTTAAKRAIFAVMIFFLPILIEFIMTLFGAYGTCGFE